MPDLVVTADRQPVPLDTAAQHGLKSQPLPSAYEETRTDCEALLLKHLTNQLEWYQKRAKARRLTHRTASFAVIVLSASLPLLTQGTFPIPLGGFEGRAATLVALLVAITTGLAQHFRWDEQWNGYKRAELELEALRLEWEGIDLHLRSGLTSDNLTTSARRLVSETRRIAAAARRVVEAETRQFFESQIPSAPRQPSPDDAGEPQGAEQSRKERENAQL